MINYEEDLKILPVKKIDQKYFTDAMDFLNHYGIIECLREYSEINLNLNKVTFNVFKEWMIENGNLDRELPRVNKQDELVGLSVALTDCDVSELITIKQLQEYLDENEELDKFVVEINKFVPALRDLEKRSI